jgi:hypothetical protein
MRQHNNLLDRCLAAQVLTFASGLCVSAHHQRKDEQMGDGEANSC